MKKLYQVEITYNTYVLAEDDGEAEEIAIDEATDEQPEYIFATEIKAGHRVPIAWKGALVYGDAQERKIEEIIAELT